MCVPFVESALEMTEWEMNYHFCTADMMKYTFSREHPYITGQTPNAKSHKRLCKKWLSQQSAVIKEMGEPAVTAKYKKHLAALEALKTIDSDGSEMPEIVEVYDDDANGTYHDIDAEVSLRRRGIGGVPLFG